MKNPDPKTHLQLSLVKSLLCIIAGIALLIVCPIAGIFLIIAEMVGILEELF